MDINEVLPSELSLDSAVELLSPVAVYVLGMAVYALFVFKFYRFVAARDMFALDLSRYEESPLWCSVCVPCSSCAGASSRIAVSVGAGAWRVKRDMGSGSVRGERGCGGGLRAERGRDCFKVPTLLAGARTGGAPRMRVASTGLRGEPGARPDSPHLLLTVSHPRA